MEVMTQAGMERSAMTENAMTEFAFCVWVYTISQPPQRGTIPSPGQRPGLGNAIEIAAL